MMKFDKYTIVISDSQSPFLSQSKPVDPPILGFRDAFDSCSLRSLEDQGELEEHREDQTGGSASTVDEKHDDSSEKHDDSSRHLKEGDDADDSSEKHDDAVHDSSSLAIFRYGQESCTEQSRAEQNSPMFLTREKLGTSVSRQTL